MTQSLGIEPGPHWWEASALTTAPSLLPPNRIATFFSNRVTIMFLLKHFLSLTNGYSYSVVVAMCLTQNTFATKSLGCISCNIRWDRVEGEGWV